MSSLQLMELTTQWLQSFVVDSTVVNINSAWPTSGYVYCNHFFKPGMKWKIKCLLITGWLTPRVYNLSTNFFVCLFQRNPRQICRQQTSSYRKRNCNTTFFFTSSRNKMSLEKSSMLLCDSTIKPRFGTVPLLIPRQHTGLLVKTGT